MLYEHKVTLSDLRYLFGFEVSDFLDNEIKEDISRHLVYRFLDKREQNTALKNLDLYLREDNQIVASRERTAKWQDGWSHNLAGFRQSKSYTALQPQYYRAKEKAAELIGLTKGEFVYRLNKKFIATPNPNFEEIFAEVVRQAVLRNYFYGFKSLKQVEFGCGSCLNVLRMIKDQPNTPTYAIDFVQAPLDIAKEIGVQEGIVVQTFLQDMRDMSGFTEDFSNSRILTFGALEQLGGFHGAESWLKWVLTQNNSSFVLIEPIVETYDLTSMVDVSALAFHLKRGYTSGIAISLRDMEQLNLIRNLAIRRIEFGSLFIEGYTLITFQTLS